MSAAIKVCLYNEMPEASEEIRFALAGLGYVRMQTEVSTPEALGQALKEPSFGLVLFHLDPDPSAVCEVIEMVSARHPDLALVGISHSTEPVTILTAMRAGCDQFVCEPVDPQDLVAAIGRVTARRLSVMNKSKSICVMGASGGAGATAIACNLALEIGQLSNSTCGLVDLDLQFGNAANNFDCHPKHTFCDAANLGAELDQAALKRSLDELPFNVALLARPNELQEQEAVSPESVSRILQLLATLYDHVVVDLPRTIDQHTFAAIEHADYVLIICQQSVPSVRNAARMRDVLLKLGIPEERLQIIVNRLSTSGVRIQIKDVEAVIGKQVFATVPNDYGLVTQSVDFGKPFAVLDKDNQVRVAIRKIATLLTARAKEESNGMNKQGAPASKGFFKKLFAKST